jgi:alkanesulfonate monooxygenase SsuD/methylene tetrahydromethanopterin reductase-like flavin-dependent oxidoreductase (luciferase family)
MDKEPEPRARRRTARRVVDWHRAADLLAQGMSTADVAARLGCSRATLARRRKHDSVFQSWMARSGAAGAAPDDPQFTVLRPTLHGVIEKEVRAGNVRVVLWLSDRLKLVTPPNERTPDDELRRLLSGLTTEELLEFEGLRDAP